MSSLTIATRANQALTLPPFILATAINQASPEPTIALKFEDAESLQPSDKGAVAALHLVGEEPIHGGLSLVTKLASANASVLRGKEVALEEEWISKAAALSSPDFKSIEKPLVELDAHLMLRSYIIGYSLTVADLTVWGVLRGSRAAYAYIKKDNLLNVGRWFRFLEEEYAWLPKVYDTLSVQQKEIRAAKSKEGASYEIALPETEKGVVTRFPPEPSGYLHIGHAKAALLNDYFAHDKYKGKLLVRFDDTNPSKEKEEFQDAILEDLELMGIKPDTISHSSDFFQTLYQYGVQMIKDGNAYADDTEQKTMRDQRWNGVASERRDRSIEENLAIFEEMKNWTTLGRKNCLRAKISVDDPNKAMRDPVIYRCAPESSEGSGTPLGHHRTGNSWNIYPTYDFCCPVLDSIEGVTHALRTIEYRDRNPQYDWMLHALKLRTPHIWDFSRMNFVRTLLSKRKLTKLVDKGVVWGWDDPRFPTIRGVRRRGMTVGALREFILKQGPSRNIVNLDWTVFWTTNKKFIDPVAPRHTAINKEGAVTALVSGAPESPKTEEKPRHGKNLTLGTKKVVYSRSIIFEQEDAMSFLPDEEVTLMNWGNAFIRKISKSADGNAVTGLEVELHLAGDVKKTAKKVTWLSKDGQQLVPVELIDFDYLITKDKLEEDDNVDDFLTPKTEFRTEALADCNVAGLVAGDIIQFERKGYYRLDQAYSEGKPAVFFNIPSGKTGSK